MSEKSYEHAILSFDTSTMSFEKTEKAEKPGAVALQEFGRDGWELVSAVPQTGSKVWMFFKRRIKHAKHAKRPH